MTTDMFGGVTRFTHGLQRARSLARNRIVRNFALGGAVTVVSRLVGLASVMYLARVLGPSDFGRISMTIALVTYFGLGMTLGFPTVGIREVARNHSGTMQIWRNIAVLRSLLAFISYGILLVTTLYVPSFGSLRSLLLLYGLGMSITALMPDWVFIGLERMAVPALASLIGGVVSLGLMLLLVRQAGSVNSVPLTALVGSIVSLVLLLVWLRRIGTVQAESRFDWGTLIPLCRQALPFTLVTVSSQLYGNADLIVLGFVRGSHEAGLYAGAYKVVNVLTAGIGLLSQATFPALARTLVPSQGIGTEIFSATTVVTFATLLPIAVGGTIIAPELLRFILGDSFVGAAGPLTVLLWYVLLSGVTISYTNTLLATNRDRPYVAAVSVGTLVDLLLVALLVPRWGGLGAAAAMVFAEITILAFVLWQGRGDRRICALPLSRAVSILASAGLMALSVNLIKDRLPVLVTVFLGAITYFFALAILTLVPQGRSRRS